MPEIPHAPTRPRIRPPRVHPQTRIQQYRKEGPTAGNDTGRLENVRQAIVQEASPSPDLTPSLDVSISQSDTPDHGTSPDSIDAREAQEPYKYIHPPELKQEAEMLRDKLLSHPFFADTTTLLSHIDDQGRIIPNEPDAKGHIVPADLHTSFSEVTKLYDQLNRVAFKERDVVIERINELLSQNIAEAMVDDRLEVVTFLKNVVEPRVELMNMHDLWRSTLKMPADTGDRLEAKYGIHWYQTTQSYADPASPEQEQKITDAYSRLVPLAVFLQEKVNLHTPNMQFKGADFDANFSLQYFKSQIEHPASGGRFSQQLDHTVDLLLSSADAFGIDKRKIFDQDFVDHIHETLVEDDPVMTRYRLESIARLTKLQDIIAPDNFVQSEGMKKALDDYLENSFWNHMPYTSEEMKGVGRVIQFFNVEPEQVNKYVLQHFLPFIESPFPDMDIRVVETILKQLNMPSSLAEYGKFLPEKYKIAIDLADLKSWEELRAFTLENQNWLLWIRGIAGGTVLVKDDLSPLKNLKLRLYTAEKLKLFDDIDFAGIVASGDYKSLVEGLIRNDSAWSDSQNLDLFMRGKERYGYKKMYQFVSGVGLHTAVHQWEKIEELAELSGLSDEQFYGNILQQVVKDDAVDDGKNAHQQFNEISTTMNYDFAAIQDEAQKYSAAIPRLQEIITKFNSPKIIFASWSNLKRYSELTQLLERKDLLAQLVKLKETGNQKLSEYVEKLALHPDSKVNIARVMEFWQNPQAFLEASATHTKQEIHNRKKPSNYIEIPNLDLTAPELRDALVDGSMDGLQVFTPMEITYKMPVNPSDIQPLREQVRKAFSMKMVDKDGVQEESTFPLAKNRKELFRRVQVRLKAVGMSVDDYLKGVELPDDPGLGRDIEGLIYDPQIGIQGPKYETIVATIHPKSSPEGVMAGNDTASCDSFGDGKKTLYMFNPNTAAFTLQVQRANGMRRTIAQSTLTKDKDIKKSIPQVIEAMGKDEAKADEVLPPDVLTSEPTVLACDNIEVAENYKTSHARIIEAAYQDFFREYMQRFATAQNLDPSRVVIGLGYSETIRHLPSIDNTFAPLAPMSYSDKTDGKVYVMDLTQKQNLQKEVTIPEISPVAADSGLPLVRGLSYLTFEDTLSVAYIEGKAYKDNPSLMSFLSNMENALIAKDINNATKGRPDMSLKYADAAGITRGYILAYEGIMQEEHVPKELGGTNVVFISDLASDGGNALTGGRLIQGFSELYKTNYLDEGKLIPLYLQARDATSYRILQRQLENIGERLGISFEMREFPTYSEHGDLMHPVLITPKKSTASK